MSSCSDTVREFRSQRAWRPWSEHLSGAQQDPSQRCLQQAKGPRLMPPTAPQQPADAVGENTWGWPSYFLDLVRT